MARILADHGLRWPCGAVTMTTQGFLHVLFSPRAEGCPRLALDLIAREREETNRRSLVAFCVQDPPDLLERFRAFTLSVHDLGWRPRGFASLFWRTHSLLRAMRPRGIVCYTLGLHVPIAAAARMQGVPIVVHVGSAPPARDSVVLRKLFLQMQAGRPFVTAHAACSDYVTKLCISNYGLPASLVTAVPNGINLDAFFALRRGRVRRRLKSDLHIGMVASLELTKDHPTLFRGFAALLGRGVNARLRIVGDGERRRELATLAAHLDIADRIEWTGAVNDVASELGVLDVFAFAATEGEGLGIALVEALAAGLPVVASDVGACREVLENGRWGRLVRGTDPDVWADALAGAMDAAVPAPEELARYDVRETYRAYARLLGDAA